MTQLRVETSCKNKFKHDLGKCLSYGDGGIAKTWRSIVFNVVKRVNKSHLALKFISNFLNRTCVNNIFD